MQPQKALNVISVQNGDEACLKFFTWVVMVMVVMMVMVMTMVIMMMLVVILMKCA